MANAATWTGESTLHFDNAYARDNLECVTRCGRICLGRRKINLSSVFTGLTIGIREVDDQIWLVSFLEYHLGYFGKDADRV